MGQSSLASTRGGREQRRKEIERNVVYISNGTFSATKNKVVTCGKIGATGDKHMKLVFGREALDAFSHFWFLDFSMNI